MSEVKTRLGFNQDRKRREYALLARTNTVEYERRHNASMDEVEKAAEEAYDAAYAKFRDAGLPVRKAEDKAEVIGMKTKRDQLEAHGMLFPDSDNIVSKAQMVKNAHVLV